MEGEKKRTRTFSDLLPLFSILALPFFLPQQPRPPKCKKGWGHHSETHFGHQQLSTREWAGKMKGAAMYKMGGSPFVCADLHDNSDAKTS